MRRKKLHILKIFDKNKRKLRTWNTYGVPFAEDSWSSTPARMENFMDAPTIVQPDADTKEKFNQKKNRHDPNVMPVLNT